MALPVPSPSYAPASTVTNKSITTSSGPAQGGGGGGGGGGAVTSVNGQTGSVVLGASDVGADPAGSAATAQAIAEQYTRTAGIQYATGGNVQVQFGLGVIGVIQLSTNIVFSPAGSAGILPGCWQSIILANNTAGAFTITKNSNWVGVVPTSIAPGQTMAIFLQGSISPPASTDANIEVDVVVTTQATTSGVTQIVAGTGITVSPGGGTGVVTVNATGTTAGRTVFNIETYGAIANSSGAAAGNVTAINAAVAAAVAFGGGTVYFPDGFYYTNAVLSYTPNANIAFIGNGLMVSGIIQVTAGADGLKVDQSAFGSVGVEVRDLSFICASGTACGNGCTLIGGGNQDQRSVWARNLLFIGGNGWINGLVLPAGPAPIGGLIENIYGRGQNVFGNSLSTGSLIYIENPVNTTISKWYSWGFKSGLHIKSVAGVGDGTFQGVNISDFLVNGVSVGIDLDGTSVSGGVAGAIQINNGVIDLGGTAGGVTGSFAIRADTVDEIKIHQVNCTINGASPTGISILNKGKASISHCDILTSGSGGSMQGIVFSNGANNIVHDNTFLGWTVDVDMSQTGVTNSVCHHNTDLLTSGGLITTATHAGSGNQIGTSIA